jgi:hypothetical protein
MAPLRGRKCADFRGLPATPWWGIAQKRDACVFRLAKSAKTPVEGHAAKKDIPMLIHQIISKS